LLFSVFYFLKIHFSFQKKREKYWFVYMSFRFYNLFLVIFRDQVLFKRTPKSVDLNLEGKGGGSGVKINFTNGFPDPENLWGDGFVKKKGRLIKIKIKKNVDLNLGGKYTFDLKLGLNFETGFELSDPELVYGGDD